MLCKLKNNLTLKIIFGLLLITTIIFSAQEISILPPATTYTPYIYCFPMQNCTYANVTQANILAFISSDETSMQIQGLLYYENETRSKIGIPNAQMFARYSCNDGTRTLCRMYSNSAGEFNFNLNYIRSTCSNCTTISFYYCPSEIDDFESLTLCLGESISSFPEYCEDFSEFSDFEEYTNYTVATQPVRFCIPSVTGATNQICMGMLIIFGILGAAMFISGRNPMSFFNFAGPKPPTGRPYRMKPKSVSFTMMVPIGKMIGGAVTKEIAKTKKNAVDSKKPKISEDIKDIKKGIAKSEMADKPKATKTITGITKTAGLIRQVKLAVQGTTSRIAVGIFGEKTANIVFGESTSQSARMAQESMQGMNLMGKGSGISQQLIAGPPIDYSASLGQDILTGISTLGDYWLQSIMNRMTMGFLPYRTLNKLKGKLIYGPLSRIGIPLSKLGYKSLNKNEKLFIKNLQNNWDSIDSNTISVTSSKNGKILISATDKEGNIKSYEFSSKNGKILISATDKEGNIKSYELRAKNLDTIKQALRAQGSGLNGISNHAYSSTVEALIGAIATAVLIDNLNQNNEKINEKLNKIDLAIEQLEEEKKTATGRRKIKIEKEIEGLTSNRTAVIWAYSEEHLPKGIELSNHQVDEILDEFTETRNNTGTGSINQKIQEQLNEIKLRTNEMMRMYFLSRTLLPNAYSISTENSNYKEWEEKYKKQKEKEDKKKEELEKRKKEIENSEEFILKGLDGLSNEEKIEYTKLKEELEELEKSFRKEEKELIEELNKLSSKINIANIEKLEIKIVELSERISALKSVYQEQYGEITENISNYSNNLIILVGNASIIHTQFSQNGMNNEAEAMFNVVENTQTIVGTNFLEEIKSLENIQTDEEIENMRHVMDKNNSIISLTNKGISPLSNTLNTDIIEEIKDDDSFKQNFEHFIENLNAKINGYILSDYEKQYKLKKEMENIEKEKQILEFMLSIYSSELEIPGEGEEIKVKQRELEKEYEQKEEEYKYITESTEYGILAEGHKISFEAASTYVENTQKPSLSVDTNKDMPIATTQYEMYTEYKEMKTEFDDYYSKISEGNINREEEKELYIKMNNTYEMSNLYRNVFRINEEFINEYSNWSEKERKRRNYFIESWKKYNEELKEISSFRTDCQFSNTYSTLVNQAQELVNTFRETQSEELEKINQKSFKNLITGDVIGFYGAHTHNKHFESLTDETWQGIKNIFGRKEEEKTFENFDEKINDFRKQRKEVEKIIDEYKNDEEEVKRNVDSYLSYHLQDFNNPNKQNLDILKEYIADPKNENNKETIETILEMRYLNDSFKEKANQQTREAYRQRMYNNYEQVEYNNYNATKYQKFTKQLEKSYKSVMGSKNKEEREKALENYKKIREKIQKSL